MKNQVAIIGLTLLIASFVLAMERAGSEIKNKIDLAMKKMANHGLSSH